MVVVSGKMIIIVLFGLFKLLIIKLKMGLIGIKLIGILFCVIFSNFLRFIEVVFGWLFEIVVVRFFICKDKFGVIVIVCLVFLIGRLVGLLLLFK